MTGNVRDISRGEQEPEVENGNPALSSSDWQTALMDVSFEPIFVWDRDGGIIDWNAGAEIQYGFKRDEVLGKNSHDVLSTKHPISLRRFLKKLDADGYWIGEVRHTTKDGRELIVESRQQVIRCGDRRLVLESNRDITERRAGESQIALLIIIGDLINKINDPDDLLFAASKAVGEYFKARRCLFNEIYLENDLEIIHRDYARGVRSVAGRHRLSAYSPVTTEDMITGRTVSNSDSEVDPRTATFYTEIYEPAGERSYVAVPLMRNGDWTASLWVSDDQPRNWSLSEIKLLEVVGERIWTAVEKRRSDNERKRSESELRESEERRKLAQEAGKIGIFDWDIVGGKTYWSETMWSFYGEALSDLDPDETFWSEHIHDDDRERVIRKIHRVVESDSDEYFDEFRINLPDDNIRWIEARAAVLRDMSGSAIRMYGVNSDVTSRKEAEEKMQHLAEELQRAHDELEVRVAHRTKELAETNAALLQEMREREIAEKERIKLLGRLVSSQEFERRRIALDLHDQMGQRLTALRLKIASLQEITPGSEAYGSRVARLQEIAERLDSEVSFMSWEIRPSSLDDLGLLDSVAAFVDEWSRHHKISAEFHSTGISKDRLDSEIETHLYRITQEALNNVAKHADAKHVSVVLERRDGSVILIVEDDGKGFDPKKKRVSDPSIKGLGLIGMSERAILIGGEIEIESSDGKGSTIYVRIPNNIAVDHE